MAPKTPQIDRPNATATDTTDQPYVTCTYCNGDGRPKNNVGDHCGPCNGLGLVPNSLWSGK